MFKVLGLIASVLWPLPPVLAADSLTCDYPENSLGAVEYTENGSSKVRATSFVGLDEIATLEPTELEDEAICSAKAMIVRYKANSLNASVEVQGMYVIETCIDFSVGAYAVVGLDESIK
jgi:hypothetical protein